MTTLADQGQITTQSFNHSITDSAASATAYACGIKTNNTFLGLDPNKTPCKTLAEEAIQKNIHVSLLTTDSTTGATPAAFYAHTQRNNILELKNALDETKNTMNIKGNIPSMAPELKKTLSNIQEPFFVMAEGAYIDKHSHNNDLKKMNMALTDFDNAVKESVHFAQRNKKTTVIVLADHETGGLNKSCQYTQKYHTGVPVPLFSFGNFSKKFIGQLDNIQIHNIIRDILFK